MITLPAASALLLLASCASFTASDAPADAAVTAVTDGGPESSARTGVTCGSPDSHCAPGEKCCSSGAGPALCALDCVAADASFYVYECGRASDCASGQECCGAQNGTSLCDGRLSGSTCVGAGNCTYCIADGGGGGAAKLCDPKASSAVECGGKTCTLVFDQSSYRACSL